MRYLNPDMHQCIEDCRYCQEICAEEIARCMANEGGECAPEYLGPMQDCVDLCQVTANSLLRGSATYPLICGSCAAVCERCAALCDQAGEEQRTLRCAEACRRCEESCRRLFPAAIK